MQGSCFQKDPRDQDIICKKSGGGRLIIFGIPFFIVGILALLTCVGVLPLQGDGGEFAIMASGFFGIVFAAVGGVLIFGRSGLIIDRGRKQVVEWQGLIIPLRRTAHPLDRFVAVRLKRNDEDRTTQFPVLLEGDGPAWTIAVESPADYRRARRTAEELAGFLGKPLEDLSSGRAVIRKTLTD